MAKTFTVEFDEEMEKAFIAMTTIFLDDKSNLPVLDGLGKLEAFGKLLFTVSKAAHAAGTESASTLSDEKLEGYRERWAKKGVNI